MWDGALKVACRPDSMILWERPSPFLLFCKPAGWRRLLRTFRMCRAHLRANGAPSWLQPQTSSSAHYRCRRGLGPVGMGQGVSGGKEGHATSWTHSRPRPWPSVAGGLREAGWGGPWALSEGCASVGP